MTTADTEYQAVSKLAKADRHFRYVQYLTAGLIAALFMFAAIRLISMEQRFEDQRVAVIQTAERLASDGRIRDEEERRYITCLLLVPIEERSAAAQEDCFDFSDLPGGLDARNFAPTTREQIDAAAGRALEPNR